MDENAVHFVISDDWTNQEIVEFKWGRKSKKGRHMEPALRIDIEGLREDGVYKACLTIEQADEFIYKKQDGKWTPVGRNERGKMAPQEIEHTSQFQRGDYWMEKGFDFSWVDFVNKNLPVNPPGTVVFKNGLLYQIKLDISGYCDYTVEDPRMRFIPVRIPRNENQSEFLRTPFGRFPRCLPLKTASQTPASSAIAKILGQSPSNAADALPAEHVNIKQEDTAEEVKPLANAAPLGPNPLSGDYAEPRNVVFKLDGIPNAQWQEAVFHPLNTYMMGPNNMFNAPSQGVGFNPVLTPNVQLQGTNFAAPNLFGNPVGTSNGQWNNTGFNPAGGPNPFWQLTDVKLEDGASSSTGTSSSPWPNDLFNPSGHQF